MTATIVTGSAGAEPRSVTTQEPSTMTIVTRFPAPDPTSVASHAPHPPLRRPEPPPATSPETPYGDSDSSGGIQLSDDQSPSTLDDWLPIQTYLGIKWVPTVDPGPRTACADCPVLEECAIDVANGDFAWCERIIPADYQLTTPHHTAHTPFTSDRHDSGD